MRGCTLAGKRKRGDICDLVQAPCFHSPVDTDPLARCISDFPASGLLHGAQCLSPRALAQLS